MSNNNTTPLLELSNLKKYFNVGGRSYLKAVDDVNIIVNKGETLGLVGESGCGKSTLGRVIVGIYDPSAGTIKYDGQLINRRHGKVRKQIAKKMQIIFQDPYASLDPRMTVGSIIAEGMEVHKMYDEETRKQRVYDLLELVGLNREHANRFPHEFSGGQRQRIGIARSLAVEP